MILKEKVYLPNYMWVDEYDYEYNVDNELYRVNGGEWKPFTKYIKNRVKELIK